MEDDDGRVRYAPNSADVMAMMEVLKFEGQFGITANGPWLKRARALFEAWYASIDIPDATP